MSNASSATGLIFACLLGTASITLAAEPDTEDPNNWPQYNRTANQWRYSRLDQINKDNVGKISIAWKIGAYIGMFQQVSLWKVPIAGTSIREESSAGRPSKAW
jgi:hypothetical protein